MGIFDKLFGKKKEQKDAYEKLEGMLDEELGLTPERMVKMQKKCTHCGKKFYEPKTLVDKTNFEAMQQVRVGCSKCKTPVCFSCAATAADERGKEGNCFCPKCGAELGRGGEAGELGEHFSGWD